MRDADDWVPFGQGVSQAEGQIDGQERSSVRYENCVRRELVWPATAARTECAAVVKGFSEREIGGE